MNYETTINRQINRPKENQMTSPDQPSHKARPIVAGETK